MNIIDTFLVAIGVAVIAPAAYLAFLTVASVFARSKKVDGAKPETHFAVLVPAHDEEKLLPELLESLRAVDYPKNLVDVFVVADNCTDSTAQIAANYGASVFERFDNELPGKPHALRWLLQRIRERDGDDTAYVIIDADSLVSANFLRVMDYRLRTGSQVVQSYYTVSNATQSAVASLRHAALALMHYVRPMGRKSLGLSCGLFGTGMVFRRDVLDRFGWDSFTLAEDVEFFMKLTGAGIKVEFAHDAVLSAQMPTTLEGAKSQNLRWERGRLAMARRYGCPYLFKGLIKGNFVMADAGFQQIIPPMSVTALATFGFAVLSVAVGGTIPTSLGVAAVAALSIHILGGLLVSRMPLKVYRAFLFAPVFVGWKMLLYAEAMIPKRTAWVRTKRS